MSALILTVETNGEKMFAVHAAGCADLAKRKVIGEGSTLVEMAFAIAKNYGGFSDNGDAPKDEAHALSWATVKACARKAVAK